MTSRFPLADNRSRLWLGLILPALALAAIIAHLATVHAQPADQLTVYSPQTSYSVPLLDVKGLPYAGLVDLLEPLGDIDARPDGKKYKVKFTPPGGRAVEAQFNEARTRRRFWDKTTSWPRISFCRTAAATFRLSSVPEILDKLLAKPVQLHAAARRLFIGDVPIRFSLELDKSTPPKLVVSFPSPVNPTVATEPGRVRFTFRREPVVSNGQDSANFENTVITGAVFAEHDGLAELDVMGTAPLMASFADGGKTIIVTPVPPPPPAPPPPTPQPQAPAQAQAPQPKPPSGPRFLVIIDPAHGGADSGASITASLVEKDVVLALARRVQRELASHGIAAGMLRNSDVAIPLDQRAASVNAARPALYITLARRQHRTRCACLHLDAAGGELVARWIPALGHRAGGIPRLERRGRRLGGRGAGFAQAAQHHAGRALAPDEQHRRARHRG